MERFRGLLGCSRVGIPNQLSECQCARVPDMFNYLGMKSNILLTCGKGKVNHNRLENTAGRSMVNILENQVGQHNCTNF